jgi:polysaccharide export outer membrane protein
MGRLGRMRGLLSGFALIALAGCSALPAQGPTVREITHDSGASRDFLVVDLSPTVVQQLTKAKRPSLVESFGSAPPAPIRTLEAGDVVSVTVWDAGGGLFGPPNAAAAGGAPGTQQTTLPNQIVDPKGMISVPFGGQIRVGGKSTLQAQQAIVGSLANKALQPQALITIVQDQSNLVTVIGDVKAPNRLPLDINGMRALDAIARAGGAQNPAYEEVLQLTRHGIGKRVRLSQIIDSPAENIYLQPDDTVYLLHNPTIISVLGATNKNTRVQFDTEQMTLAEALGLAGGLRDQQAESTGVFVFRLEPPEMTDGFKGDVSASGGMVPVIFRANLRGPRDYFIAQTFQLQDKDIVYVANAETTQLDKLLVLLLHAGEIASIVNRAGNVGVNGP